MYMYCIVKVNYIKIEFIFVYVLLTHEDVYGWTTLIYFPFDAISTVEFNTVSKVNWQSLIAYLISWLFAKWDNKK
jgi:hypothetical protein